MSNLMGLEIPVGITSTRETFELKLFPRTMMNCYISGRVGSGKSNLLRAIIKNSMNKYNDVNIWLLSCKSKDFNDLLPYYQGRIFDIDIPSDKAIEDAVLQLHNELRNRLKILSKHGVNSFSELSLDIVEPRLLVLIDDFYKMGTVLSNNCNLSCIFEEILATGRAVGIYLILTNQVPKSQCLGLSCRARDFIQVLISFNNQHVLEALDISEKLLKENEKDKIYDYLIDIGNFVSIDNSQNCETSFFQNIAYVKTEYVPYKN